MALQAFTGLGIGHNLIYSIKKVEELKQGKNDTQASLYQIQGLSSFTVLANQILSLIPSTPIRVSFDIVNSLLPFAGLIACPTSAMVKQGNYEDGVKYFDAFMKEKCPRLEGLFPQKLDETRAKILNFLADHTSTLTTVGVATTAVALPFLGLEYLAVGIGLPILYHTLESANLVPTRVRIAVEKYMPTIVNASLLLGGGPISKALSIITLSSLVPGDYIQKNVSEYVLKKVNKFFHKHMEGASGPSLDEIDAPWVEKTDLSFDDINYILENDDQGLYDLNPAHCSKQAHINVNLPENRDFKSFLTFFEKFNWKERYHILLPKFKDDDRFVDLLKQKFPEGTEEHFRTNFDFYIEKLAAEIGLSKEEYLTQYFDDHLLDLLKEKFPNAMHQHYREHCETYIGELAAKANISKEEYLAQQLSEQMNDFVLIMCKEKAVKGFAYDLEDAIDSCSLILGYLHSMPDSLTVEVEDILIKLSIEGGDYCARGIKRAAAETALSIIVDALPEKDDPLKVFELRIRQQLQLLRHQIMQNLYAKMIEGMVKFGKEGKKANLSMDGQTTDAVAVGIAQDVHTMDLYRNYLSLGFYPLTSEERSLFGLTDLVQWAMYTPIRNAMYQIYRDDLDKPIKEIGEVHFAINMRQKINGLQSLSTDQKEALVEKLAMCAEGEKTLKSFRRLFYVMQGILTIKPILIDWTEITNEPLISNEKFEDEINEWVITDCTEDVLLLS